MVVDGGTFHFLSLISLINPWVGILQIELGLGYLDFICWVQVLIYVNLLLRGDVVMRGLTAAVTVVAVPTIIEERVRLLDGKGLQLLSVFRNIY